MTITITVTGHAGRLLEALCEVADTTGKEIARKGVAAALNGFNYQRADSREMMTALPHRDRTPVGPDLEPGEAERIRALSQLAIQTAQATGVQDGGKARIRGP